MQKASFLALLILLLWSCEEQPKKPEPVIIPEKTNDLNADVGGSIDSYFDSLKRAGRFNGVYLFARNDSVHSRALGLKRMRNREDSLELHDVFQLASLSKPISAVVLLMCLDEYGIGIDTAIQDILIDFPYEEITVRHILSHRSGMGNYMYVTDSLWNNPDSFMRNDQFYEFLRCEKVPLYFSPDRTFDYCNTNFALIPVLVEELSGMDFEVYAKEKLFDPLGMISTHYMNPLVQNSEEYEVLGHYPNGDPKRAFYLDGVIGDKGLVSSVHDLYRFFLEIKSPSVLKSWYLEEAFKPTSRTKGGNYYGLGWRMRPMDGDTIIFHNGWWRGFKSYFWMSKRNNKIAIVLSNATRGGYLNQTDIWKLY